MEKFRIVDPNSTEQIEEAAEKETDVSRAKAGEEKTAESERKPGLGTDEAPVTKIEKKDQKL